jgi:hypothetical protein
MSSDISSMSSFFTTLPTGVSGRRIWGLCVHVDMGFYKAFCQSFREKIQFPYTDAILNRKDIFILFLCAKLQNEHMPDSGVNTSMPPKSKKDKGIQIEDPKIHIPIDH